MCGWVCLDSGGVGGSKFFTLKEAPIFTNFKYKRDNFLSTGYLPFKKQQD